jgi:hypothetical protein
MNKYTIILPDEKNRTYRLVTVLIAILNFAGFVYMKTHVNDGTSNFLTLFSGSILIGQLGNYWYFKKRRKENTIQLLVAISIASICWLFLGMIGFGLLDMTFAVLGFIAFRKLQLKFFDDKIEFPSFPKKQFLWDEVENLILKDNILTIDFKNNKLLQFTLLEADNENLNEADFNSFVQQKMISKTNLHQ